MPQMERPAHESAERGIDKPCVAAGLDLNPSTQVMRVEGAPRRYDPDAVRAHLEIIHDLAKGTDGILVLAIYGANPDAESGKTNIVRRFNIGDVDGMLDAIMHYEHNAHTNIYMPLAVMRKSLERGKKGSEADVIAVLGLVLNHDDDAGRIADPILPPSYVLETSQLPRPNRQLFYLFDGALRPDEAKPLAWALRHASGGDHGTLDLSHVWRV